MKLSIMLAILWAAAAGAATPPFPGATPSYKSWIAAKLPGAPEGLAQDAAGRIYAAVSTTGEIVRLVDGGRYVRVATVPSADLAAQGRIWGVGFGPDGALYAAYVWHYSEGEEMDPLHLGCRDSRDQYTGVYRVDIATGVVIPWLTKHDGWSLCFPDDVAVDAFGSVYVTDETLPDGSAGAPVIVAGNLTVLDGVALDERGNIYVSEVLRNEIAVYSPDGNSRIVVATADTAPLVSPTSLVYRDGVLCTANLGWHVVPDPRTIVCLSGFKRPAPVGEPHR